MVCTKVVIIVLMSLMFNRQLLMFTIQYNKGMYVAIVIQAKCK